MKYPFVEAEDIKNLVSVSKPTVNKLLDNLMDMEILELVEDKKGTDNIYIIFRYYFRGNNDVRIKLNIKNYLRRLEKQIRYFEDEIKSYHQRKIDTDKFLKMIEKHTDIEELTVPMINEYLEKIIVYKAIGRKIR